MLWPSLNMLKLLKCCIQMSCMSAVVSLFLLNQSELIARYTNKLHMKSYIKKCHEQIQEIRKSFAN